MAKRYDKLVRDRIPEIIRAKGQSPVTHVATPAEYREQLRKKLVEETEEFLRDENIGEIAGILEVIDALCREYGFAAEAVSEAKEKKRNERGGFEGRVILEEA